MYLYIIIIVIYFYAFFNLHFDFFSDLCVFSSICLTSVCLYFIMAFSSCNWFLILQCCGWKRCFRVILNLSFYDIVKMSFPQISFFYEPVSFRDYIRHLAYILMSLPSSLELKYELKKKEECKIIIVPIVSMLVLQRRWVAKEISGM